jgi:hypothetical protein
MELVVKEQGEKSDEQMVDYAQVRGVLLGAHEA